MHQRNPEPRRRVTRGAGALAAHRRAGARFRTAALARALSRAAAVRVSNLRAGTLGVRERAAALQLKQVVTLARHAAATDVRWERPHGSEGIGFVVARGEQILLRGSLPRVNSQEARWPS